MRRSRVLTSSYVVFGCSIAVLVWFFRRFAAGIPYITENIMNRGVIQQEFVK